MTIQSNMNGVPNARAENTNGQTNGYTNGLTNSNDHAESSSTTPPSPIAIIGMSCRFGGDATSPSKLWDLCVSGKDSWSPIPAERFDGKSHYNKTKGKLGRVSYTLRR
jgi:hypothetical protein